VSPRRLVLGIGLAVLVAPAAFAQGIGDVAARERESREKTGKKAAAAPVYTDHDLAARRPPGSEDDTPDVAEASETSSAPSRERDEPERERREADTAPQTDAVNRAQAEVDSIERRIRELNGRLNPMSRDYVYGEARSGDAAGEELRIRTELSELQERLVQARQDLARANEGLRGAREPRRPERSNVH
jgi:chromosome segregation ATPase